MTTTSKAKQMTDQEATDEAVLLIVRRLRRTQPDAFAAIWPTLPEGARIALQRADIRADVRRDKVGPATWPEEDWDDESGEE